jgi:hypothetical protein
MIAMRSPRRFMFLTAALAIALGGCAGGVYVGGDAGAHKNIR